MEEPVFGKILDAYARLQECLVEGLRALDGQVQVCADDWERPGGGGGWTRVLSGGEVWEKSGVNRAHVFGKELPAASTARRPELAGKPFAVTGVSVVVHPCNPYVPAAHMNVRFFEVEAEGPVWWTGGGFDLTPAYPFDEDIVAWHRAARDTCEGLRVGLYGRFKAWCDRYFYLPHRQETRGVGGIFFDDFAEVSRARAVAFTVAVGETFLRAYTAIAGRRMHTPFEERERQFQLYRRGRYAEFNLLYDRGTRFGLKSGGRTESILMSLPPLVRWEYGFEAEPGSAEAALTDYLRPREWLRSD